MESFRVLLYAVQEYNVLKFAEINCVAILDDREFITQGSKIVLEWNGPLENISRPQVIGNSREYLLLRRDIQKGVVGRPCLIT